MAPRPTHYLPPTPYYLPRTTHFLQACPWARRVGVRLTLTLTLTPTLTLTLTLTLAGMEVGKKVIVKIPPEYAYGKKVS